MMRRALILSLTLSATLAGCSDGEEVASEEGSILSEEARLEQQADSLEEAADKAMQIEIDAMEGEQAQAEVTQQEE